MHTLTDGRDCEDGTSIPLMETLQKDLEALSKQGVDARVASGGGRMCTTMDRYEVCVLSRYIKDLETRQGHIRSGDLE